MMARRALSNRKCGLVVRLLLLVLVLFASATIVQACNVPVFRFALERWRADAYRVTVLHRGPLSEDDRRLVDQLGEKQDKTLANIVVRTLDVSRQSEPTDQALLDAISEPQFPLVVVQYPAALRVEIPVWSQRLSSTTIEQLLDSPLRKELLQRLLDGETAVWVVLECADADKNEAAATLLKEQLAKLARQLQLPELTDSPDDNLVAKTPLKLSFSMLRVPRVEAEAPLAQMLVRCESDLIERDDPMVFPVFGRGRALLPLIGAGITAENIHNSAAFLVGACSCEVKELNPGFDLLMTADWEQLLSANGERLPIVPTRREPEGAPEIVPIPAGSKSAESAAMADPVDVNRTTDKAASGAETESSTTVTLPPSPVAMRPVLISSWSGLLLVGVVVVTSIAIATFVALARR